MLIQGRCIIKLLFFKEATTILINFQINFHLINSLSYHHFIQDCSPFILVFVIGDFLKTYTHYTFLNLLRLFSAHLKYFISIRFIRFNKSGQQCYPFMFLIRIPLFSLERI